MCGLVGVASNETLHDHEWLNNACKSLIHRGPDDHGIWWSENRNVGLAHQRLSILDLTSSGHQPMLSKNKKLSLIFNGEIYNYQKLKLKLKSLGHSFNSQSDTEVLLTSYAEWGTDCLKYLDGMFAFVLYDSNKNKIFMARDRAGEKPLFYHLDNKAFYFASELKALLCNKSSPRKIDLDSLDCYLSFGFIPANRCIFSGYNKPKPAHALTFDIKSSKINSWKYWYPTDKKQLNNNQIVNESSLINELETLLENSVKKQLVADVPVGILLSGGIDSSLITAMAARNSDQIQTFNVSFSKYKDFNESEHAKMVASHFKTKHKHLEINQNINTIDLLSKLIHYFDEPIVDSSMFPTFLLSQEVKKHCKVALGGDGADELFAGYHHYQRLLKMRKYLKNIPSFANNLLSIISRKFLPIGFKGRNYFQNSNLDLMHDVPLIANYFNNEERKKLIGKLNNSAESIRSDSIPKEKNFLTRATLMDFENYLPEDILVKVDRASMANSLEIRAPFLDYRIIEFAFKKIPSHLKATTKDKKILLKKLAFQVLPPNFDFNRKQGFEFPLKEWLKKGIIRDYFWEILTSKNCSFDTGSVKNLFKQFDRGRNNSERIFCLVQFELWRKHYNAYL